MSDQADWNRMLYNAKKERQEEAQSGAWERMLIRVEKERDDALEENKRLKKRIQELAAECRNLEDKIIHYYYQATDHK